MFLTLLSPQGTPPPAPQVVLPKVVKPWVKVDGTWKNSKIWVKKQNGWHITAPSLKVSNDWLSSDIINPSYKASVLADNPTGFWPLTEANKSIVTDSFNRSNNASSLGSTDGLLDKFSTIRSESDPSGSWTTANYGTRGYVLASFDAGDQDRVTLPAGVSFSSNVTTERFQWAASTDQLRALSDPSGIGRTAATWFSSVHSMSQTLTFADAATRMLRIYALDWDYENRTQRVSITVGSVTKSITVSNFGSGVWIEAPIKVPAGGTVTITTDRITGYNSVIGGLFLDDLPNDLPTSLTWTAQSGTWGISSNKAYLASNTAQSVATVNTAVADVDVSADFTVSATGTPGGGPNFGLVCRFIDDNNYLLAFYGFGSLELYKRDNGTFVGLTSYNPYPIVSGNTYQFRLVANGDQVKIFVDGNEAISHTLSAGNQSKYGSATTQGIRIDAGSGLDPGTLIDNFNISHPIASIAEDVSGNNLDATYQRFGMIDSSNWKSFSAPRFLGGTNDWVSIPANTNLSSHAGSTGSWSFDAMLYDNGSSGHRVILSVSKFPPAEYEVFIYRTSGGNIIADITQSDGTSITSITVPKPPDKKWYHFAYTYDRDAAVAKIYIDGVEVGSDTTMSGVSAYTANVWRLGGRGDDSGDRWSGRMSHAAIYPTALSAAEVKRHADAANNIVLPDNYSNFTSTSGWAKDTLSSWWSLVDGWATFVGGAVDTPTYIRNSGLNTHLGYYEVDFWMTTDGSDNWASFMACWNTAENAYATDGYGFLIRGAGAASGSLQVHPYTAISSTPSTYTLPSNPNSNSNYVTLGIHVKDSTNVDFYVNRALVLETVQPDKSANRNVAIGSYFGLNARFRNLKIYDALPF